MMGKYGQHRNIILWRYIFCRMKIVAVIKAKMAKMFLSRGKWPIFEEQIIPIWNIWSLMVEIMVSWSDWCSQSNSPALSFTSLQHQEKCGKKLIGILDQITPDMYFCWYHNITNKFSILFSPVKSECHAIPGLLKAEDRLFQFITNYRSKLTVLLQNGYHVYHVFG